MGIPQNLRLIIFDFDGTLLHLGVDWDSARSLLGVSSEENLGKTIAELQATGDVRIELITELEVAAATGEPLSPEVARFLAELQAQYSVAILTRNSRKAVAAALSPHGLDIHTIGREDVRALKPDPEGATKILRHFGTTAAEALLLGDTYHDVLASRAAGIWSVVVHNQNLAYAPEGADLYIDKLDDLIAKITYGWDR